MNNIELNNHNSEKSAYLAGKSAPSKIRTKEHLHHLQQFFKIMLFTWAFRFKWSIGK